MPHRRLLPALLGIAVILPAAATAAPLVRLQVDLTHFSLDRQIDENRSYGGVVLNHEDDSYNADSALRVGIEALWPLRSQLEALLGASLSYSGSGELDFHATAIYGGALGYSHDLDRLFLLNTHAGLRWQPPLTDRLHARIDLAASANQWRYEYDYSYLAAVDSPSSLTLFVTRQATAREHDSFFSLDGGVGLAFTLTPRLEAGLDYGTQYGHDYRNEQVALGLRYTLE